VLVGEQVVVLRPLGENDRGIVFPSLYHIGSKEPNGANAHTAIVAFSDGCVIKYDTQSKTLSVDACTEINLVCSTFVCHGDSFFKKNVDITGALDVGADITTDGSVTDALGDLSNFTTTDGSGRA